MSLSEHANDRTEPVRLFESAEKVLRLERGNKTIRLLLVGPADVSHDYVVTFEQVPK